MIDAKDIDFGGLLDKDDPATQAYVEAGMAWGERHTHWVFEAGEKVPADIRLFLVKFCEIAPNAANGVSSESIGGMSQSFTGAGLTALLDQWASVLLGAYGYSLTGFIAAEQRWV